MNKYVRECAKICKALGDTNRLMIVDLLTGGELCACKILEKFNITQPTLSHHMKALCGCGLVTGRKQGKWTYYSISKTGRENALHLLKGITNTKKRCLSKKECCE